MQHFEKKDNGKEMKENETVKKPTKFTLMSKCQGNRIAVIQNHVKN